MPKKISEAPKELPPLQVKEISTSDSFEFRARNNGDSEMMVQVISNSGTILGACVLASKTELSLLETRKYFHPGFAPSTRGKKKPKEPQREPQPRFKLNGTNEEHCDGPVQICSDYQNAHYVWTVSLSFKVGDGKVTPCLSYEGDVLKSRSECLGVSMSFLMDDEFSKAAVEASGLLDPTFAQIGKAFWTAAEPKPFMDGDSLRCPRDKRIGCSIVDTLDVKRSGSVGKATLFVSWVWRYTLLSVLSAFRTWVGTNELGHETDFVWMCFFCNNQYRLLVEKVEVGSDSLGEVFAGRLKSIGQVLVVLDDYMAPIYVNCIWCCYETYVATRDNVPLRVVLPESCAVRFQEDLQQGRVEAVRGALGCITVETAQASHKEDETNIKSEIAATVGYTAVNDAVKTFLSQWLGKSVEIYLKGGSKDNQNKNAEALASGESSEARIKALEEQLRLKDNELAAVRAELQEKNAWIEELEGRLSAGGYTGVGKS